MWNGVALEILSREEEQALARRYRATHEPRVEDRLVRSQLRLAAHLVRAYHLGPEDREDLIQEGALGIVEAVRRFDPDRGVRLSSYAVWWIRAYQLRYLMENHRLVRMGSTQAERKLFWNLRAARARLVSRGAEAGPMELARELGVDDQTTTEMTQRLDAKELSLDVAGAERRAVRERTPSEQPDAEEMVVEGELIGVVRDEAGRLRDELDERDRAIFDNRFKDEPATLAALGDRFGVSRERARQLEGRVLRKLEHRVAQRVAA
jgi:RNA polymerase sigma-32 factor